MIFASILPDANVFVSGLKATDRTRCLCPLNYYFVTPPSISHINIVLSALPEANILLSGLKDTEKIELLCPLSSFF